MAVQDITAAAVQAAIVEFDEIGREAFLARYKIGPARGHYLIHNGKKYDAKALVAAAHGRLLGKSPLRAEEFQGGEASTKPLIRLGFQTVGPADAVTGVIPYERGRLYHRQTDVHQQFGGQERGGIATPDNVPFIFVFTGETGARYGYEDRWVDDGTFEYTGEGRVGPMEFVRGNRAIRDHAMDGKDILLFEADKKKGLYRYLGPFGCSGFERRPGKDENGQSRQIIVFKLAPTDGDTQALEAEEKLSTELSLEELRKAALEAAVGAPSRGSASAKAYYLRSAKVREYVLARAGGICEACKNPAPFRRLNGEPYLEPHHTRRLADGGPDHPRWVGAVCPACHRNIHHGAEGKDLNERLIAYLATLEEP